MGYDYLVVASGAEYDYDFIGGLRDAGVTYYSMEAPSHCGMHYGSSEGGEP